MRHAFSLTTGSIIVVLPILAVGCGVPQEKYDDLLTATRVQQEEITILQEDNQAVQSDLAAREQQLNQTRASYEGLQSEYQNLNSSVADLDAKHAQDMMLVASLDLGPLPAEVELSMNELAARNNDMLTYDADQGVLRFSSDFTFDLGSDKLSEEATDSINALAGVLNDAAGQGLEARIVGHTDNVPIRRAETKRLHPTNMHLSVHRAIAVQNALIAAGVDRGRLRVEGYGSERPLVPNGPGGAKENRRVEIFLAASTGMAQVDELDVIEITGPSETPTEPDAGRIIPMK